MVMRHLRHCVLLLLLAAACAPFARAADPPNSASPELPAAPPSAASTPKSATPLPPTTTQERHVNPTGLTEPQPYGWHTDFIGFGRGVFDASFGVKLWWNRFYLRNLIFGGSMDLAPGLRIRAQFRRHEGEKRAFQVDPDEVYAEAFDLYTGRQVDGGVSLRVGHIRYLHFPYPDAIALFDQVPGISDLYGGPETDYRLAVLEAEASLHSGWGVHFTGRAGPSDIAHTPDADVIEAYAFYRSDFWRYWHFEARVGDIAVRREPLGRPGQPGADVYLGRQIGEFNVGLLYEHKRTEPDFAGISLQLRSTPITRALGRYMVDYSRKPEGFTAQIPLLHLRMNESRFVRHGDVLVGEIRAVRVRTLWQQGFVRNEYEYRLENWGKTSGQGVRCVVTEEPWYLQTEALVSPHLLPNSSWFRDRQGPGMYVQRVTYRFYVPKPTPGAASAEPPLSRTSAMRNQGSASTR